MFNRTAKASSEAGKSRSARAVPWIVLAGTTCLSLIAAIYVGESVASKDAVRFRSSTSSSVREICDGVRNRVDSHIALLRGGSGLFAADPTVDRDRFGQFVQRLNLSTAYPGMVGMGFARWVDRSAVDGLVQRVQKQGDPAYHVWPATTQPKVAAIEYLEPQNLRNRAAMGFDMYSEPARRDAMDLACDSGAPAASAKVTLIQEIGQAKQAGFLIYVPIYANGAQPQTMEERRAQLIGFVFGAFRADDLLSAVVDSEVDSSVAWKAYDGDKTTPDHLMHRSYKSDQPWSADGDSVALDPMTLNVAGRKWTITFVARPEYETATAVPTGVAVLMAGLLISLALFRMTRSEVDARTTAEKSAAALLASQQAMRESEHRFRTLFEQSPLSIQIFAPDGRCVLVNRAWQELWGSVPEDVRDYNVLSDPQLESSGVGEVLRGAFAGQTVSLPPIYYDPAKTGRPGRPRWVVEQFYPVQNLDGKLLEMVLIQQDVTELKLAEQERGRLLEAEREARAAAESANRTKDDFLATLSHELRTPLNAILGWSQLLKMGGMEPDEFSHALDTIERNARVQAQLVEDLLDLSRIITGKLKLQAQPVDLPFTIDAAIDSVRPTATAKGITLIPVLDSHATPVMGDAHRLQQIAWNLLTNAIKFTPEGGTIQCFLTRGDAKAEFVVSDTGVGISPEFMPHIFERLRQADSSTTRRHGGLGLGLAIVRHLVELHGGTVSATSRGLGKGSTFTVTLPLVNTPRAVRPRPSNLPPRGDGLGGKPLAGLRLLVVDDEPDARELLGHILQGAGAQVKLVTSAAQALAELARVNPHVLLSDISMPDEDGYSLVRRVRTLPQQEGGSVPAIALTALARTDDRQEALLAGYQMHMAKPVEPEQLIEAVANLAGRGVVAAAGQGGH